MLLLEKQKVSLLLHRKIMFVTERRSLSLAFVAYLASFYLVNMGYPKDLEVSFSVMQWIIFGDYSVRGEVLSEVQKIYDDYKAFSS